MSLRAAVAATLVVVLPGCLGDPESIEVGCNEFSASRDQAREIKLAAGDSLELALCSNKSTGYSWGDLSISEPGKVESTSHEYEGAAAASPGTPGIERWSFESKEKGVAVIRLAYSQQWEGGEKEAWVVRVTVIVE